MSKGRCGVTDKYFKRQRPKQVRREETQKAERTGTLSCVLKIRQQPFGKNCQKKIS